MMHYRLTAYDLLIYLPPKQQAERLKSRERSPDVDRLNGG